MSRLINKFFFFIYISSFSLTFSNKTNYQLIITMLLDNQSSVNVKLSIKSILNQNVEHSLYKIILMVSNKNKNLYLSDEFITFIREFNIQLNIIKKKYNFLVGLIAAFKQWPNKPILLIKDDIIFPEGWLEMYINDNKKYPNDIIVGSIQYFLGNVVSGWSSLFCSIWFLGGVQLLSIGIIGQYVGKTYIETKMRPRYNIEEFIKPKTLKK